MRLVLKANPAHAFAVLHSYTRSREQLHRETMLWPENGHTAYLWWRAEWLFRCIEHLGPEWRYDTKVRRAKRELYETCKLVRGKNSGKASNFFRLRKLLRQPGAEPVLPAPHGTPELHP